MENELVELVQGVKSAADARFGEIERKSAELAERMQGLEQSPRGRVDSGQGARPKTFADLVLDSAGLTQLRNGEIKSLRIPVKSFELEKKAVILTTSGAADQPYRANEIFGPMTLRVSVRTLIPTQQIGSSSVDYAVVGRTGLAGAQIAEGDVKPQMDLPVTLMHAPVVTIAVWTAASQQVMLDNLLLRDYIGSALIDSLRIAEDQQILGGLGTAGTMNGIKNVALPYTRSVVGDSAIDAIRRAATQVQLNLGAPSGVILSPVGLETLELKKSTQGEYILELEVDSFGRTNLWRIPVVTSVAMGPTDFIVGDFANGARLYDRQMAQVQISMEHADYFTRNLCAILAEERLALAVARPNMFVQGTLPA